MEKIQTAPKPLPMGQYGNKTIFTTVIWFSHKQTGEPYTYQEKQDNKNRFFIPSFDYTVTEKGQTVTTHNLAYTKIMGMLARKQKTIITALVEYNASPDGYVYRVAKVTQGGFHIYAQPVYGIGKNLNDVIIRRWEGNPVRMNTRNLYAIK